MANEKEMDAVSHTNNQIEQIFANCNNTYFPRDPSIPIGQNEAGDMRFKSLREVPHLLVAGISESGKTSYIRTLITSLVVNYSSDQVRIAIIDTKSSDYGMFVGVPHLFGSVITDLELMKDVIKWMREEIGVRLKAFAEVMASDLIVYNEYMIMNGEKQMPALIIVIDDISFFRIDASLFQNIVDILVNGRSAGIHLVVAMSPFPSKKVCDEVISRFPCRAVFKVNTSSDSKDLLVKNGAEMLKPPEEMIYRHFASCEKYRTAYIPLEIAEEKVAKYAHPFMSKDVFEELQKLSKHNVLGIAIPDKKEQLKKEDDSLLEKEGDPLFNDAVDVILNAGYASVSILQRRLNLSYPRSSRLIDAMAEKGYIGPFEGSKPRKVLISYDEWQRKKSREKRDTRTESAKLVQEKVLREKEESEDMRPVSNSNSLISKIYSWITGRKE